MQRHDWSMTHNQDTNNGRLSLLLLLQRNGVTASQPLQQARMIHRHPLGIY
jgi:hypothetical protein